MIQSDTGTRTRHGSTDIERRSRRGGTGTEGISRRGSADTETRTRRGSTGTETYGRPGADDGRRGVRGASGTGVRSRMQPEQGLSRKKQSRSAAEPPEERAQYTQREWARIEAKERAEKRYMTRLILIMAFLVLLTATLVYATWYFVWRSHDFELFRPFDYTSPVFGIDIGKTGESKMAGIADGLCVAGGDINPQSVGMTAQAAGLFDLNRQEVRYAKDIFSRRSPASITKVMTALLTLKYGNLDELVTVSEVATDIEYGSSVCDIHVGDVLTLRQLLYGMMIASGNDAAMVIAEHLGGSVSGFVDMMNQEARLIGATDTHFENPHGLTAENHYTTVYDIYLMFQAAAKYDLFQDIINRKNYYAEYRREDGSAVAVTWESTNYYFTKQAEAPEGISVFGGKTGTTENAGACLALMAKDNYGNPYIAVILHSDSKDTLYPDMNQLLRLAT